jgi:hypothetical protein
MKTLLAVFVTLFLTTSTWADEPAVPANRAALETKLAETLTGAALVGTFSVDGREGAKPERYEIASAKKLEGDNWVVTARIKYGDNDVSVPLVVKMLWAGDTPILTLDELTIPGLGTFTSRVMFHGDRYAGTWQHGDHGGHLWGKIQKTAKPEEKKPEQK